MGDDRDAREIVARRRRARGPFQRSGIPGIVAGRLAMSGAAHEVDGEQHEAQEQDQGSER